MKAKEQAKSKPNSGSSSTSVNNLTTSHEVLVAGHWLKIRTITKGVYHDSKELVYVNGEASCVSNNLKIEARLIN